MVVVDASHKIEITNLVLLGDIGDLFWFSQIENKMYKSFDGGLFLRGNYTLNIIEFERDEDACVLIICEESIDPVKIDIFLKKSNFSIDIDYKVTMRGACFASCIVTLI